MDIFKTRAPLIFALAVAVVLTLCALGGILPTEAALPFAFAMATVAFPVNPELTAIAIGYKNSEQDLIADEVLPRVPTAKKFVYTKYDAAQGYTVPETLVGRKSEPDMVDFGGTLINDECVDFGLDDLVPNDETEAWEKMPKPNTLPSPMAVSTMLLTHLVQLRREIRVAATVFAAATYPAANKVTLSGTSQWSHTSSDPVDAILGALDTPLIRPNTLVLGRATWTKLRQHAKIVQAIIGQNVSGGKASRQAVADLFELDRVLIGGAFYNTAKKGATPTYARAWGKHAALLNISPTAAQLGQPTFGFTAQFGTKIAGNMSEPRTGLRGGERIRSGESVKEVISASDVGYFFENAVA
jgi:hypothetical protein